MKDYRPPSFIFKELIVSDCLAKVVNHFQSTKFARKNFVAAYHLFQGTGIQRIRLTLETSAKSYNAFSSDFFSL
jgi:hypothetical protein